MSWMSSWADRNIPSLFVILQDEFVQCLDFSDGLSQLGAAMHDDVQIFVVCLLATEICRKAAFSDVC